MPIKSDWTNDDWFGSEDQNDVAAAVNTAESDIDALESSVGGKADAARTITAGTGLSGGGNLTADRTLSADFGTGAGKVCQGNDSRLSDARTPTAHTHSAADTTSGQFAAARMPTGYKGIHVGTTAPGDTNLLWLDTN